MPMDRTILSRSTYVHGQLAFVSASIQYLLVGVAGCLRIEDTRTFARAAPLIIPNDDPDGWAIVRGGVGAQNNAKRRVSSY